MTEWDQIINADWPAIARQMRQPCFLFDGRNALDQAAMVRLVFEYRGVGRNGMMDCHSETMRCDVTGKERRCE